jgi:hypothetical protein
VTFAGRHCGSENVHHRPRDRAEAPATRQRPIVDDCVQRDRRNAPERLGFRTGKPEVCLKRKGDAYLSGRR